MTRNIKIKKTKRIMMTNLFRYFLGNSPILGQRFGLKLNLKPAGLPNQYLSAGLSSSG